MKGGGRVEGEGAGREVGGGGGVVGGGGTVSARLGGWAGVVIGVAVGDGVVGRLVWGGG